MSCTSARGFDCVSQLWWKVPPSGRMFVLVWEEVCRKAGQRRRSGRVTYFNQWEATTPRVEMCKTRVCPSFMVLELQQTGRWKLGSLSHNLHFLLKPLHCNSTNPKVLQCGACGSETRIPKPRFHQSGIQDTERTFTLEKINTSFRRDDRTCFISTFKHKKCVWYQIWLIFIVINDIYMRDTDCCI